MGLNLDGVLKSSYLNDPTSVASRGCFNCTQITAIPCIVNIIDDHDKLIVNNQASQQTSKCIATGWH